MKIETLKDLKNLVNLMRKTGIDKIKVDGVELELGSLPEATRARKNRSLLHQEDQVFIPGGIDEDTRIDMPDALTEEQLLMWSATGGQELGTGETV